MSVQHVSDCFRLQNDVDSLGSWCVLNNMKLNISKCSTISFTRGKAAIVYQYSLQNEILKRVDSLRDLGVIFHKSLSFNLHFESILNRANRMVGFLKRSCRDFYPMAVIRLYYALVRPILEYCCIVWCPIYGIHVHRLEAVQRKFVNYVLFRLNIDRRGYSYEERLSMVGLQSLETRRKISLTRYGYKILRGVVNCSELFALINRRIPAYVTRLVQPYLLPFHRTNYGLHSPVSLILRLLNEVSSECDVDRCSLPELNRTLLRIWPT